MSNTRRNEAIYSRPRVSERRTSLWHPRVLGWETRPIDRLPRDRPSVLDTPRSRSTNGDVARTHGKGDVRFVRDPPSPLDDSVQHTTSS